MRNDTLSFEQELVRKVPDRIQILRFMREAIGTKAARRSGATELARRNVPIATISKLVNHTNTNVTSRYIFADTRNLGEEAITFFNAEE